MSSLGSIIITNPFTLSASGGGLSAFGSDISVDNSTIAGNASNGTAGGIEIRGNGTESLALTVRNSIIAGNTGSGSPIEVSDDDGPIDIQYSLIGDSGCGTQITVDQVGNPRPNEGACDAGAYEYRYIDLIFADTFEWGWI